MNNCTSQFSNDRTGRSLGCAILLGLILGCLLICSNPSQSLASGEERGELVDENSVQIRTFTNKQGQEIEARVVSLGGSMRTVSIERPDGRRFDIEIVSLSLDDQQFLKDWLKDRPAIDPKSLSIRISAEGALTEVSRERFEDRIYGGSGTRNQLSYRFSITNQSRHPLVDVRLEYAILLHDVVSIRAIDPDEPDSVRWKVREQGPVIYRTDEKKLIFLKYNTTEDVITEALDHQAIRGASSRGSAEDIQVGVLARLLSKNGAVLAEFSDIDHSYPQITWEEFEARRGTETAVAGHGELVSSVAVR